MNDFETINKNKDLIKEFYLHIKELLKFNKDAKISFLSNKKNSLDPFGKTAYYDPEELKVYVYINGRHIKDILRSLSHELIHHEQNCSEKLINMPTTEGYAQENEHLREMERDAFERGNMIFRDFCDNKLKGRNNNG